MIFKSFSMTPGHDKGRGTCWWLSFHEKATANICSAGNPVCRPTVSSVLRSIPSLAARFWLKGKHAIKKRKKPLTSWLAWCIDGAFFGQIGRKGSFAIPKANLNV